MTLATQSNPSPDRIDRHALVTRHNVILTEYDGERPLQVGNGEFAFGMDITGLQTFAPFNTMAQWGWHTGPLPSGKRIEDYKGQTWDTHGRPVRYPMFDHDNPEISHWLAANPHKINLGRIGLSMKLRNGAPATEKDIKKAQQRLDLWSGVVTSQFELEGTPVTVKTACHPKLDSIVANVESPLIQAGRLTVFIDCPGNNPLQFANFVGDWSQPGKFDEKPGNTTNRADFTRRMDNDVYSMSLTWQNDTVLKRPSEENPPDLQIISARYGAGEKWLDVTEMAKREVKSGRLRLTAGNALGPDPILGTVKTLQVKYRSGSWESESEVKENETLLIYPAPDRRRLSLVPAKQASSLSFTCSFSPKDLAKTLPTVGKSFAASREAWPKFWSSGGAIDLSGSKDPRWRELERRIVLSQYLMKLNAAGSLPPQESGLVNNGWFGKFHMEMVWWHKAHWALWNRWSELSPSLEIYRKLIKNSVALAKSQGYKGARWPKAIGPDLHEWPHEIHGLLIWQQPHPIFFAQLDYRAHPTRATWQNWAPVVEATADFMASYAHLNPATKKYDLGPPMVVVSENTNSKITRNPTYELGYWRFGLRSALDWRKMAGLAKRAEWEQVLKNLAPLPIEDGVYVTYEDIPEMWTKFTFEHPGLTGAYGMLPGDGVDRAVMARTFDKVAKTWDFERTWGWDFPMLAMCAARLGKPEQAIDFLLHKSSGFQFDARGLATGGPFPYFPSNGGLLYAVAMMAKGWEGSGTAHAPGFPKNGQWKVRYENLSPAL